MSLSQRKGQSTLEFAVLIAVVVSAVIAMQIYMKRGVSGKLKSGVDEIGEQYDPIAFSSNYTSTSYSKRQDTVNATTRVTKSELLADEISNKTGSESVDAWVNNETLFRGY